MGKLVLRVFGTWKAFVIAVLVFLYGVPGMLSDGAVWWGVTGEGLPLVPYVIATIGAIGIIAVAAIYVRDQRSKSRAYEELAHHVSELKAWMDQSGVSLGQKAPARAVVPANTASPKLPTDEQALDLWMEQENVPAEMQPELRLRANEYMREITPGPLDRELVNEAKEVKEPAHLRTLITKGELLRNKELERQVSDPLKARFQPMHSVTQQMARLSQQMSGPVEVNDWLMMVAEYVERNFPSFKGEIVQSGLGGGSTGAKIIATIDQDLDVLSRIRELLRR